jgi:hypothetical protein
MTTTAVETMTEARAKIIGREKSAKAKVASAYGKELKEYALKNESGELITEVPVSFSFLELDPKDSEHVAAARALYSDEDIVKAVNADRKASALATERTRALKNIGVEAPAKESEEVIKANLRRQFANMNLPEAIIAAMVEQTYQAALAAKQ